MVIRPIAVLTLVTVAIGAGHAQDKGPQAQDKATPGYTAVKVELALATVHVPKGLKAGMKVDLKHVTSATVAPNGLAAYSTVLVVEGLEVVSVTQVEKPADPEQAVKVEVKGTKQQAEKVEAIKARRVNVSERRADGTVGSTRRPPTLRLELSKADK
jgi:hypothetical protein